MNIYTRLKLSDVEMVTLDGSNSSFPAIINNEHTKIKDLSNGMVFFSEPKADLLDTTQKKWLENGAKLEDISVTTNSIRWHAHFKGYNMVDMMQYLSDNVRIEETYENPVLQGIQRLLMIYQQYREGASNLSGNDDAFVRANYLRTRAKNMSATVEQILDLSEELNHQKDIEQEAQEDTYVKDF